VITLYGVITYMLFFPDVELVDVIHNSDTYPSQNAG
jgi:hypothetical protein